VSLRDGTQPYIRNLIEGSAYFPAAENIVVAGRARFGSIFGIARDELAPSRRLYAGGGGSVRGYGYQQLGPRIDVPNPKFDPDDPDDVSPTISVPIGGRSLTEFADRGPLSLRRLRHRRLHRCRPGDGGAGARRFRSALRRRRRRQALHQFRAAPRRCRNADRSALGRAVGGSVRFHRAGILMADQGVSVVTTAPPPRRPLRTVGKWVAIVLGIRGLAGRRLFLGINSDLGRRYVVRQINNLELASGLDIDVGRIEGSIYGSLTIHDITLKDPKGTFFYAPRAELDWRPLSYFQNHIDIRAINIPEARLRRQPELRESGDPNAPLLPDLDIDVGRFRIGRLAVDPPITGQRHLLSLDGRAKISDGRAQVAANVGALTGPGIVGGDKLVLRLDAVPDQNRFDLGARVDAPANGFVASMTGIKQPLVAAVGGRGSWSNWQGRAQAILGGRPFANLSIGGRDGTFTVSGPVRPGQLVPASFQKLVSPLVQVNLVTSLAERRANTRLR
jgi:hypothetical protein